MGVEGHQCLEIVAAVAASEVRSSLVGHASTIELTLTNQPATLTLTVIDDGAGIPAGREHQALRGGHVGLAAARERIEAPGGSLRIDTAPAEGTTVTSTLPTRRVADRTWHAAPADEKPDREDRRMLSAQRGE